MKKSFFKNIIFALTIVVMIGLAIVLSACGHEHTYGEWVVHKKATCTQNGVQYRTCECGEEEQQNIPATGHTAGDWVVDIEPTCVDSGSKTQRCTVCSAVIENVDIDKLGHRYSVIWTVELRPTCTSTGIKYHQCSRCDDKTDVTAMPANGHTDGEWIIDNNPTCTENGSKHQVCLVCNDTIATDIIAPTGHSFGKWTRTLAPTCTEKGSERRNCSVCEHFETKEIPATGHSYGEWTQTLAPTCTEKGSKRRDCEACEHFETQNINATGHTNGKWITDIEATCTENGSKHQVCTICTATIQTNLIPAMGHVFGNWYIEIDASCASEGLKARICSCGAKEYKTFSVIHTTDFVEAVEMSGIFYEKRYCSICAVEFHKPYDAVTVDLTITKLSISDNVTFGWQISASGGIGEKKYYCVVYERYSGKILTTDAYYGYTGAVRWDGNDLCVRVYMYDDVGIVVYDFVVNHGSGNINNPPETIVEPYHLI